MSSILQMFSYGFILRALIVGALVSLCSAILGVNLVLKKFSFIGDGLSHVGFGALSVALALNLAPMTVAIPVVTLSAFLLIYLKNSKVNGDSAIALISTSALAIGVLIISISSGMNVDVYNYMFGSILSLTKTDTILSIILCSVMIIVYILLYNKMFAITFDENFAKATGVKTNFYNIVLALFTAITIVIGMRLMGALLISALIVFPALSSMRIFKSYKKVIITSGIFSVVCFFIGIIISYTLNTAVGASVVCINLIGFIIFTLISKLQATIKRR